MTTTQLPDPKNVQGFILRGYTHPFSCHLLFSFSGVKSTPRDFFRQIYPEVQSAESWGKEKPASMLNIGITFNGIKALGIVTPNDLNNFPPEFQAGPWSGGSQSSLGDYYTPASAPLNWWNKNFQNEELHCVIHTYGLTKDALDKLVNFITSAATSNGVQELMPLAKTQSGGRLYQAIVDNDKDKIHFGYTDGISEPAIDNSGKAGLPNPGDVNNFLIGYSNGSVNEPGPTGSDSASAFSYDGCYNAFRILYQDVAVFNKFLKDQVKEFASELAYLNLDEAGLEEWFAAKLCGRWRNGSPLILSPDKEEAATASGENFGYVEQNDNSSGNDINSGAKCPFSGHTRVANPRNQALDASEGMSGPPRILRRGMPYGAQLNSGTDDGVDRGLIGLFFCGTLAGQFEKLYGWMNTNNFSSPPVFSINNPPQDALLGNRDFPDIVKSFIIPIEGNKTITVKALPQFLETRGTAYCLLPSLSAIRSIAGIENN